jgi:prepilin-type N-terminal cleavage/methylation domain-containing protein
MGHTRREPHFSGKMTRDMMKSATTRPGYSLVELLTVLALVAILLTFAIPTWTNMTQGKNAQNARDNLVWMGARARAKAIEQGRVWQLEIDPALERARVRERGATTAQDSVTFTTEFQTEVATPSNTTLIVCYTPRGYALMSCNASEVDVTFTHRDKSAVARVKPLGQIERI